MSGTGTPPLPFILEGIEGSYDLERRDPCSLKGEHIVADGETIRARDGEVLDRVVRLLEEAFIRPMSRSQRYVHL